MKRPSDEDARRILIDLGIDTEDLNVVQQRMLKTEVWFKVLEKAKKALFERHIRAKIGGKLRAIWGELQGQRRGTHRGIMGCHGHSTGTLPGNLGRYTRKKGKCIAWLRDNVTKWLT